MRSFAAGLAVFLIVTGCPSPPRPADEVDPRDAGDTPGEPEDAGTDAPLDHFDPWPRDPERAVRDAGPNDAGPEAICSQTDLHNGGDGSCVPRTECSAGYFLREDGFCTAWQPGPDLPGYAYFASTVVVGNRVYVMCVSGGPAVFTEMQDGDLADWRLIEPLPPERLHCEAEEFNGKMILVGGIDVASERPRSAHTADVLPDGSLINWTEVAGVIQISRDGGDLQRDGARLIYGGGLDDSPFGGPTALEAISFEAGIPQLSSLFADLPTLIWNLSLFSVDGTFYAMGDESGTPEVWGYSTASLEGGTWSPTMAPGRGQAMCFASDGQNIFALGGSPPGPDGIARTVDSVYVAPIRSDASELEWRRAGPLGSDVDRAQCAVVGEHIVILGGVRKTRNEENFSGTRLVHVARLDAVLGSVEGQ